MRHLLRGRRIKLLLALALLLGLIGTFPLSLAFRLAGLDSMAVSARSLRGPVWWGGAEQLQLGGVRLGTVDVFLDPVRLLIGEVRIDIARLLGKDDDISGGISFGFGHHGLVNVTGPVPLAAALAPLPINRVELDHFWVRFAGDRCVSAKGHVRVRVPALVNGLNLANGFSGEARCEGAALLLPLASQSGQETLDAQIFADGRYTLAIRVKTSDPALTAALAANGFAPSGDAWQLRATGAL